jgi:uncharacterized membrane protein YwzB
MNRLTKMTFGACISLLLLLGCVLLPAYAQGLTANKTGLNEAANKAGYTTGLDCVDQPGGCVAEFAGRAINALSALLGAVFLALILYGGFLYLFSRGEEKLVKSARDTIMNAVIGLVIVVISYAVANYVLDMLMTITSQEGGVVETTQSVVEEVE